MKASSERIFGAFFTAWGALALIVLGVVLWTNLDLHRHRWGPWVVDQSGQTQTRQCGTCQWTARAPLSH